MGKRRYEQKTYMEEVGGGFWRGLFKWAFIIIVVLVILGAVL